MTLESFAKNGSSGKPRFTRWERLALVASALGIVLVLMVARRLEPSPSGMGTHEQLGLGPCTFMSLFGKPCPSCGMTTSFAWFVRGQFLEAARVHPGGALLAASSLVLVPWLLVSAGLGRSWGTQSIYKPITWLVLAILAISLLAWTFRMEVIGGSHESSSAAGRDSLGHGLGRSRDVQLRHDVGLRPAPLAWFLQNEEPGTPHEGPASTTRKW